MNEEELSKFIGTLERFADSLRELGEVTAAEAVKTILKYVKGRRKRHDENHP